MALRFIVTFFILPLAFLVTVIVTSIMENNLLKNWRIENGKNQKEAGEAVGVERVTWWRWEKQGSPVDIAILAKVSEVTGIPRQELRPDIFGEAA